MPIKKAIESKLKSLGADFYSFVDISELPAEQNKRFHVAILFGVALSQEYVQKVSSMSDYVESMIRLDQMKEDEFHLKEKQTDWMADETAAFLQKKRFSAYSQSEANIEKTGFYNIKVHSTPLPHKAIALMAGLGWIGKHDLLVTSEYGSAVSMCTVLTDAPLETVRHTPKPPLCGSCRICLDVCSTDAIQGKLWDKGVHRDELVDVSKCTTCLQCMMQCPWTQEYVNSNLAR